MLQVLCVKLKYLEDQAQWLTSLIPTLREAKVGGSFEPEFETSLGNTARPGLCKKLKS